MPTTGEVSFADHRLTGASEAELTRYRREHVGFVFQFYNLIPSLTVRENVALVTDIVAHPMDIDEAISLVGLAARQRPLPGPVVGRRTAAGGDRARDREEARGAAVRRAEPARSTTPPASWCST